MKYCKDCRHFPTNGTKNLCGICRPNVITGREELSDAVHNRLPGGCCGPDAQHFLPRGPYIVWQPPVNASIVVHKLNHNNGTALVYVHANRTHIVVISATDSPESTLTHLLTNCTDAEARQEAECLLGVKR